MKTLILAAVCLLFGQAALADNLYDIEGDGIPRTSEAGCQNAGKELEAKLNELGFKEVGFECVGTAGTDIGDSIPAFQAHHEKPYLMLPGIGPRRENLEECEADLKEMLKAAAADEELEAECVKGEERDYKDNKTEFYQAWTTALYLAKEKK